MRGESSVRRQRAAQRLKKHQEEALVSFNIQVGHYIGSKKLFGSESLPVRPACDKFIKKTVFISKWQVFC